MGERLAVDPEDDSVLYLASPGERAVAVRRRRRHLGAGRHLPGRQHPRRHRPVVRHVRHRPGGRRGQPSKTIFVGDATGNTVYESTDAGATWQQVPGDPAGMEPQHGVMAANGTFYVDYANEPGPNGMTDGSVWKYAAAAGTWTNITPQVPGANGNPSVRLLRARR